MRRLVTLLVSSAIAASLGGIAISQVRANACVPVSAIYFVVILLLVTGLSLLLVIAWKTVAASIRALAGSRSMFGNSSLARLIGLAAALTLFPRLVNAIGQGTIGILDDLGCG